VSWKSLEPVGGELFIVDSGSGDGTLDIGRFFTTPASSPIPLKHTPNSGPGRSTISLLPRMVPGSDADQRSSDEFAGEISYLFAGREGNLDSRRLFLTAARSGAAAGSATGHYYPKYLLKLFRPRKGPLRSERPARSHFYIPGPHPPISATTMIEGKQIRGRHHFWIQKAQSLYRRQGARGAFFEVNGYQSRSRSRLCGAILNQRTCGQGNLARPASFHNALFLFLLPLTFSGRFLDGRRLIFHFLHAFWFRLLWISNGGNAGRGGSVRNNPDHRITTT